MPDDPTNSVTLREWLGFKADFDLSKARTIGVICGVFLTIFAILIVISVGAAVWNFFAASLRIGRYSADIDGTAVRNIGLSLAGLLGAPFVVWRSIIAAKQAQTAAESLFNDKISSAAQDLSARREVTRVTIEDGKENVLREWEDDVVTRVAAIDRLEGLSSERPAAAPRISRLLATFIRGNFPCLDLKPTEEITIRKIPRLDLQSAVGALGRIHRIAVDVDKSHWRLDLKSCNFDGVSFRSGHFFAADFTGSRFEASILSEGEFIGCIFRRALLNHADFWGANMTGAKFDYAIWNQPVIPSGRIAGGIWLANITGATFIAADITSGNYLGSRENLSKTFGTLDTKINETAMRRRPDLKEWRMAHDLIAARRDDKVVLSDEDVPLVEGLERSGFQNWSPYEADDGITGFNLTKFYNKMSFNRWPYAG